MANNEEPLSGAKFQIVSTAPTNGTGIPANSVNRTVTSAADGKVTFNHLPVGNYEIYELYGTDAKEGYVTNDEKELIYMLAVTEETDEKGEKETGKPGFSMLRCKPLL